jgi:hypothetical protein
MLIDDSGTSGRITGTPATTKHTHLIPLTTNPTAKSPMNTTDQSFQEKQRVRTNLITTPPKRAPPAAAYEQIASNKEPAVAPDPGDTRSADQRTRAQDNNPTSMRDTSQDKPEPATDYSIAIATPRLNSARHLPGPAVNRTGETTFHHTINPFNPIPRTMIP